MYIGNFNRPSISPPLGHSRLRQIEPKFNGHNTGLALPQDWVYPPNLLHIPTKALRDEYTKAFDTNLQKHLLNGTTTWLFREHVLPQAVAEILKDGKSTAIHILGSSDFSTTYSYAIAAALQDKTLVQNPKQLKIIGVDSAPDLIGLAKTGHIVISVIEALIQDILRTPLQGGKLYEFFTLKKDGPKEFDELVKNSPKGRLLEMIHDPVAKLEIGKGMEWYEANLEKLPAIGCRTSTMENYVTKKATPHQRQIYVLANSWNYLLQSDNPKAHSLSGQYDLSPAKLQKYFKVIQDIKAQNKGKEVLIILGDMEDGLLQQPEASWIKQELYRMGMKPMTLDELKAKGVDTQPAETGQYDTEKELTGKIWKLTT